MELWKDVINYEGLYQVSNLGNVRNRHGHLLKPRKANHGYLMLHLCSKNVRKGFLIHRLVLSAFMRPPIANEQGNHKNGIKTDNNVNNIEWVSPKENMKHAHKSGLFDQKGERHNQSKLKVKDVKMIRNLIKQGVKTKVIAGKFNVGYPTIAAIKNGYNWKHLK